MKLKGTQTEINLARAYASECQARTRYEFIEYGARYNGYKNIADVIDEIAYQEFNHSRMFYTFLQDARRKKVFGNKRKRLTPPLYISENKHLDNAALAA